MVSTSIIWVSGCKRHEYTPPVNYIPELGLYISYDGRSNTLYLGKDSANLTDKIVYSKEPLKSWSKILFVGQDNRIYAFGFYNRASKKVYEKELDITSVTINDSSTIMRCSKPINASEWIYKDFAYIMDHKDSRFWRSEFGDITINHTYDHGTISMKNPKYVVDISFMVERGRYCLIDVYDNNDNCIREYKWE